MTSVNTNQLLLGNPDQQAAIFGRPLTEGTARRADMGIDAGSEWEKFKHMSKGIWASRNFGQGAGAAGNAAAIAAQQSAAGAQQVMTAGDQVVAGIVEQQLSALMQAAPETRLAAASAAANAAGMDPGQAILRILQESASPQQMNQLLDHGIAEANAASAAAEEAAAYAASHASQAAPAMEAVSEVVEHGSQVGTTTDDTVRELLDVVRKQGDDITKLAKSAVAREVKQAKLLGSLTDSLATIAKRL